MKRHRGTGGTYKTLPRRTLPVLFVLILISCASSPRQTAPGDPERDDFSFLAPGGSLYFSVDVPSARPLLDLISWGGFSAKDAGAILARTGSAAAAVYPEGGDRRFLALLRGRYPRFRSGFSFAFNSAWKRARSETGERYWRSAPYGLSVFLAADRALVSDGDPFSPPPGTGIPGGFAELRRGAILAGWLEDAGDPINQFLAQLEIPIQIPAQRALFGVYSLSREAVSDQAGAALSPDQMGEGQLYEAVLRIETPSVSQARALVSIISMVRSFMISGGPPPAGSPLALAAALFAKPPVQEGAALIIHTGVMDERGIALLFNMFAVYSN